MSRHKRASKRRVKRRFMRYRGIELELIYTHELFRFVSKHGYEMMSPRMVRRYFKPARMILDEMSEMNLRAALLGGQQ